MDQLVMSSTFRVDTRYSVTDSAKNCSWTQLFSFRPAPSPTTSYCYCSPEYSNQSFYADARLATASEWDDLFEAGDMQYDFNSLFNREFRPSEAFETGPQVTLSSGSNYDPRVAQVLGANEIWSDPDGNTSSTSTRDFLEFGSGFALMSHTSVNPPFSSASWLIVSETAAVPEPTCTGLAFIAMLFGSFRRRR